MSYEAAAVEAEVKVYAYETVDQSKAAGYPSRREVTIKFNERFSNDEELDKALDAFVASVREAARR